MPVDDLAGFKAAERATWARGDYHEIARRMFWDVGARIVDRLAVGPGDRVLDVACGSGNAAIRAAQAGAEVVGVDLTPEILVQARRAAGEHGVTVEWVEGDAEELPFPDGSFDAVVSTFGSMFAPRHAVAAAELARVLAPGGRMGICSWTPQSSLAALMRTMFEHLPPAPGFDQPPAMWGSEEHVRGLFAGHDVRLELEPGSVEFRFKSVEEALRTFETVWGPFVEARELLQPQGRWSGLRAQLGAVLEDRNLSTGSELRFPGEYLAVVGTRG